ncbi:MAG: hypothetical protein IPQ07_03290 [Myxococcales bacterium]|nr:hypothetical protein [Myxococcales bacterium]
MTELTMHEKEDASMAFATTGQATSGCRPLGLMPLLCAGYLGRQQAEPPAPTDRQHLALIALMLAVIAATVFVKTKPGGPAGVERGPGFYVFAVS